MPSWRYFCFSISYQHSDSTFLFMIKPLMMLNDSLSWFTSIVLATHLSKLLLFNSFFKAPFPLILELVPSPFCVETWPHVNIFCVKKQQTLFLAIYRLALHEFEGINEGSNMVSILNIQCSINIFKAIFPFFLTLEEININVYQFFYILSFQASKSLNIFCLLLKMMCTQHVIHESWACISH